MNAYVAALNKVVADEQAKQIEAREAKQQQTARERLSPLKNRLEKLLAKIPIEEQRRGLSLVVLQASLKGKWRGRCHAGQLGTELRKLGFVRERRWSGNDGFVALWFPK